MRGKQRLVTIIVIPIQNFKHKIRLTKKYPFSEIINNIMYAEVVRYE